MGRGNGGSRGGSESLDFHFNGIIFKKNEIKSGKRSPTPLYI